MKNQTGPDGKAVFESTITFRIDNVGNTPVTISRIHLTFFLPEGWEKASTFETRRPAHPRLSTSVILVHQPVMSQKTSIVVDDSMNRFWLTDAAREQHGLQRSLLPDFDSPDMLHLTNAFSGRELFLKGALVYTDIFGEEHVTSWCWTQGEPTPENRYTAQYTSACETDDRAEFAAAPDW